MKIVTIKNIQCSNKSPFILIAGPCAIESEDMTLCIAESLKKISEDLDIPVIFKASYDKANRTSVDSYRGPGLDAGLEILYKVKEGKLIHEVDLKSTDFFRETLITITYRISIVVLLGFLLIGGVMINVWGDPSKGYSKFIVWFSSVLSLIIVIKWGLKSLKSKL